MTSPAVTNLRQALPSAISIRGFPFLDITEQGLVNLVVTTPGRWIITPNVDILRQGCQKPEIAELLRRADILVADGMPLIWASRLQRTPLPERVSGSHIIWSIPEAAAKHNMTIFLMGGVPGAADACARVLKDRFPNLRITGTYCPPFGFEKSETEVAKARAAIAAAPADIIFVALSFPKGEHLIERVRGVAPSSWWIGVGISFSFVAGEVKKAPPWMQKTGLEWIHRLLQEPRRLARRYLIDGLPFAARLLIGSAISGFRAPRRARPRW
jgi:N-acetylglucosaminyldiphosphoundecaprenol N-acetyl-beta-D-mannosaminyltransferase